MRVEIYISAATQFSVCSVLPERPSASNSTGESAMGSSGFLPPPSAPSSEPVVLGEKQCDRRRNLLPKLRRPRSSEHRVGSRLPAVSGYESMRDLLSQRSPPSSASSWRSGGSGGDRLGRYGSCGYVRHEGARSPGPTRGRGCLWKLRWEVDGCFLVLKESLRRAFRRMYDLYDHCCCSRGSATVVV